MSITESKRCSGCNTRKPATVAFFARKATAYGFVLRGKCRECRRTPTVCRQPRGRLHNERSGDYVPGPKPCDLCSSLPWRVEGNVCRCGLSRASEPPPSAWTTGPGRTLPDW